VSANDIGFLVVLASFVLACLSYGAFILIRARVRAKRAARMRSHVDKRFTPDPRDWQKHFEQYDRPAILRRQAE
jgi:hypothetical protein